MEWYQNMLGNGAPMFCTGSNGLLSSRNNNHSIWCVEQETKNTMCVEFSENGDVFSTKKVFDFPLDSMLFHPDGALCTFTKEGKPMISACDHRHNPIWEHPFLDEEIIKWNLAHCHTGNIYILYTTKNSGLNTHIACIEKSNPKKVQHIFSLPEVDLLHASFILSCKDHLVTCAKRYGNTIISYCLDREGKVLATSDFSSFEQSKGAVPVCEEKVTNDLFVLGGYRESPTRKQRVPWVCLFDSEMTPLYNAKLPPLYMEQCIKKLAIQEDGSILALASPWVIYRIDTKGFITHTWKMPAELHAVTLTSIKPIQGSECLISGNVYTKINQKLTPSIWFAKIHEREFKRVGRA